MNRAWKFFMIILLAAGMVSCNSVNRNENKIVSISLECAELCNNFENPPFEHKRITSAGELSSFEGAMNKAVKIKGELDYGVIFRMFVSFEDDTQIQYVLNIDNKPDSTGLLVDTAKSGLGYKIPKADADELRVIIYGN
ncbi:hypothetical protein SAMN05216378_1707 [Paenibacillus catalpae]|uniref:Lipoprotein n=1 Tax=Paenibacillus catalpae TaxID=1045775 RepID=A0A1I1VNS5_9BACL|nr:hypothetical protein [Paenibacillus catalpae]SFD84591.1 hypothetical protein SAMN05216378_1707 [Paenibacillus catalpae]